MEHTFTQNLLVKYIYNETTAAERLMIEDAFEVDYKFYESYVELYEAYKSLPRVKFSPSKMVIANILNYSSTHSEWALG